jgi:hypothetical protein
MNTRESKEINGTKVYARALRKVTSGELLTEQAMRKKRIGKHISAATYTHFTVEEL